MRCDGCGFDNVGPARFCSWGEITVTGSSRPTAAVNRAIDFLLVTPLGSLWFFWPFGSLRFLRSIGAFGFLDTLGLLGVLGLLAFVCLLGLFLGLGLPFLFGLLDLAT